MSQSLALADRLAVLGDALPALRGIAEVHHEAPGAQLGDLVTFYDTVMAEALRARESAIAEAVRRGETDGTLTGWIREHAPSLRQGGAQATARLVTEATKGGPLLSGGDAALDPDSPVGIVWDAVTKPVEPEVADAMSLDDRDSVESGAGRDADRGADPAATSTTAAPSLTCANGMAVIHEMKVLAPRLQPEAVPTVTRQLVALALEWGPAHMRRFRAMLLAEYGLDGELDDLHDKLAKAAYVSSPQVESGGLTEYRMGLTPAQAAAFEAAIGPLAAPAPNPETRERDLRPAGQRRAEALIELCKRVVADQQDDSKNTAGGAYATIHVNLNLEDLRKATGTTDAATTWGGQGSTWSVRPEEAAFRDLFTGEVLGSTAEFTLLSPSVLRQMACGAHVIPHVLGSDGEHLDQGREIRLFNKPQRRKLLRRDKHCTYPGCDRPGSWCRAHHVLHWLDDGASDLDNGALLCERHHTTVHQRRLWADVRATPDEHGRYVVWDLTNGSYDHELRRRRAEQILHDPPSSPEEWDDLARTVMAAQPYHPDDPDEPYRLWTPEQIARYEDPGDDWFGEPSAA